MEELHQTRRAGLDPAIPLDPFERAAALLSAFSDSTVSDFVLELGLVGREEQREWLEPALAALVFMYQIQPTTRAWEIHPEGDDAGVARAYRAIEHGTVLMGHPLVFIDESALWVLDDGALRCAYRDLDELIAVLEPS